MKFVSALSTLLLATNLVANNVVVVSAAGGTAKKSLRGGSFATDVAAPVRRKLAPVQEDQCEFCPDGGDDCHPICDPADNLCKPEDDLDCIYHEYWDYKPEVEVIIKRGHSTSSYWKVDFLDGNGFWPAWCVDVGRSLSGSSNSKDVDLYSSYSEHIPNDQSDSHQKAIDKLEFLPAVNWLLNQDELQVGEYVDHCDAHITWSDVQKAIWLLVDENPGSNSGLSSKTKCVYDYLYERAKYYFDYEPKCGGKIGIVVIIDKPWGGDGYEKITNQVIIAVIDNAPCTECEDGCIHHESYYKNEYYITVESGQTSGSSLFDVDLDPYDGAGLFQETWCVDMDRFVLTGTNKADLYSIYDETNLDNSVLAEAVEKFDKLKAVNYLVNTYEQGQTIHCGGYDHVITWKDIQAAIWLMVENDDDDNDLEFVDLSNTVNGAKECVVDKLVADSCHYGSDYEPTCHEPVLILIIFDDGDDGYITNQVLISVVQPECEECPVECLHYDDCPAIKNLGPQLMGDLNSEDYLVILPRDEFSPFRKSESGVSVLVKGNIDSYKGAEIEGNIVGLGNMYIGPQGVHSIGATGAGSGVGPNGDALTSKSTNPENDLLNLSLQHAESY